MLWRARDDDDDDDVVTADDGLPIIGHEPSPIPPPHSQFPDMQLCVCVCSSKFSQSISVLTPSRTRVLAHPFPHWACTANGDTWLYTVSPRSQPYTMIIPRYEFTSSRRRRAAVAAVACLRRRRRRRRLALYSRVAFRTLARARAAPLWLRLRAAPLALLADKIH